MTDRPALPALPLLRDPLPEPLPGGLVRFRSRHSTDQVARGLERAGWAVGVVDLSIAPDKPALIAAFARGLAFPDWVGHTWDALDDALRDLSWWPAGAVGRVVIVRGAERIGTATARDRAMLADILAAAVRRWAATPSPLAVLLRR
jgi:hypothetical protein